MMVSAVGVESTSYTARFVVLCVLRHWAMVVEISTPVFSYYSPIAVLYSTGVIDTMAGELVRLYL